MNYPDEWTIAVQGLRVRIEHKGRHYYTSAPFRPLEDAEGIRRPNPNAEALASWFRLAVACYGHPFADDNTPAPPLRPEPEPAPSGRERRRARHP